MPSELNLGSDAYMKNSAQGMRNGESHVVGLQRHGEIRTYVASYVPVIFRSSLVTDLLK